MEKQKQRYMNYNGISGNELFLINLVKEKNLAVFGVTELQRLSGWKKTVLYNTLFSMKQKKQLVKIKRDAYTIGEDLSERLFEVATSAVKPSYISFWTALSFYGFTEQQVKAVQLVSTKQHKELKFNSHSIEITTFNPQRFYGYTREGNFVIAEKEKALIDSMYQTEKCGGFTELIHCLKNAFEEISMKKFEEYLIRFGNKSMISRAGYILDEMGLNSVCLQKNISESYIKLNPEKEKTGDYNRRWNVIINQRIKV